MIRFAVRGLATRKLRTALTAIAVVLGVALVTGTYVLTDSIKGAFGGIFTEIYQGTDATITGKSAFDLTNQNNTTAPPFAQSLLARVRALPDVDDAIGGVGGEAHLIDKNGKVIVFGGAPNLGFSVDPAHPQFNSLTLVDGKWPGPGEMVIDKSTAGKKDISVGEIVGVEASEKTELYRISGLVKFGGASSLGGATLAGFNLVTAQRLFDKVGKLDQIRAKAKPGVTAEQLSDQIRKILPPGTQVRTGEAQAREDAKDTESFLNILQYFLLGFGIIALFVGAFVIVNSLSITIAQRTRELATLRTLGASRHQVIWSIVVEALVMGVLASVVGILVGLGLGVGLFRLFDAVGFTLPNNGLVLHTRTVVVAMLLGVVVTLVASLFPAFRAARVPPISAVREGATLPPSILARHRTPVSIVLVVLGFLALVYGLFGQGLGTAKVLIFMGVGAILIFFGIALLSARIAGPLAWSIAPPARWLITAIWLVFLFLTPVGWLYQLYHRLRHGEWPTYLDRSSAGTLARDNARRNPQRTASTASALMIGLALVTVVAVLAAGITKSFRGAVDALWIDGYAVTAQNNFSPIPIAAGNAAARTPGVTAFANVRVGDALVFNHVINATAVNPEAADVFNLKWKDGSNLVLARLGGHGAFVDDAYAKKHDLTVGSPLTLTSPRGTILALEVRGIFKPPAGGSPFGRVTISDSSWDRIYDQPENLFTFVRMKGGENDKNKAALERQLAGYPNAKVQTKHEFIDNQIGALSAVLNVLYVLLALSVIISLFGIVNTLVLTVFERTREIGMLRAVGMTRRQTRRMIRHESVITALIGGVLGIVLGVALGALLVARVNAIAFSLPIAQLLIFAFLAIVVGLIAAIFPARRAARLNVLEALQYE
ncbi:MAG: ABC transporter permease [Verrucomicrobiota bacterium]